MSGSDEEQRSSGRDLPRPWGPDPDDPYGYRPWPPEAPEPPGREPMFNAPWPAVVVVGAILGSYLWQVWFGGGLAAAIDYGFSPQDLDYGRWGGVVSMMFIHGGWPHAIMNALAALAFAPPVARLFGTRPGGAAAFFVFYLVCGVLSALGYALIHLHQPQLVVGASGAVSGLMGAAARLLGRRSGMHPLFSRPVLSLAVGWTAVNLLVAMFGAGALMPGVQVAWEAHIAGFLAGVVLIGPWRRLFGAPERF